MKFKDATSVNVSQDKAKMSPKVIAELERKEKEEDIIPAKEPDRTAVKIEADKRNLAAANSAKAAEAIISVNLRLEPHMNAEVLCVLYPGIKVRVNDSEDPEWYALTYQGRNCFVMKQYIKLV